MTTSETPPESANTAGFPAASDSSPRPKAFPRWLYALSVIGIGFVFSIVAQLADLGWLAAVVAFAVAFVPVVLRLHDIGTSGWWALTGLIPMANFVLGYFLLCAPTGYAKHRKADTAMKGLSVAFGVFILLIILSVAIPLLNRPHSPSAAVSPSPVSSFAPVDTSQNTTATTPPTSSEPQAIPIAESDLRHLTLRFTTPGPEAHGQLQNDTKSVITGATILIERAYVPMPGTLSNATSPPPTARRFPLRIHSAIPGLEIVLPSTTQPVSASIGDFLNPFYDTRFSPPQAFRAASRVTIESAEGYSRK